MRRRDLLALPFAGALRAQQPEDKPAPLPETRLIFGGDVMLSRYVGELARISNDPSLPFRDLAPLFSGADIAFVNLEAPFSDRGRPMTRGMVFKSEPSMIEGLMHAGIDVVSTANNHARDCGSYGVEFTLNWLGQHGIAAVGTGRGPDEVRAGQVLERNGTKFGFLAYTYDQSNGNHRDSDDRIAMLDIGCMQADVRSLLGRAAVAIVSMHAGVEYQPLPHPSQIRFARAAIDAGAKLVIGHHPHVVQTVEQYRGGVICYSLGNLVFDQFQRRETQKGLVFEAAFRGAHLDALRFLPVDIRRTVPRLA
jgi:poly-gamma-glutamate synthesis protein (capsule biosynthesis protein)